ncbi:MAG: tRNA ((37)-N6)-threonylcarbamoyltransferase complex dimerization subunit type 1 TsaB [Verrucomicrobiota bacterium]|jgi:tRNA threonylcarbamoyl adenosine modification protein YeaZ
MPAPFTLVLETATPHASLAIAAADGRFTEREFASDRSHNALLFRPLAELLEDLQLADLARVLVGSGPGSYSGTRVGIAAAQGVALATGCQVVALPSLLAVPSVAGGDECLFIGDARRGSFWVARAAAVRLVEEPALTDEAGLAAAVGAALERGLAVVSFDAAARFPGLGDLATRVKLEFPTAAGLWLAWQRATAETRAAWAAAPPQPTYLKPPHITPAKRPWLVPS